MKQIVLGRVAVQIIVGGVVVATVRRLPEARDGYRRIGVEAAPDVEIRKVITLDEETNPEPPPARTGGQ